MVHCSILLVLILPGLVCSFPGWIMTLRGRKRQQMGPVDVLSKKRKGMASLSSLFSWTKCESIAVGYFVSNALEHFKVLCAFTTLNYWYFGLIQNPLASPQHSSFIWRDKYQYVFNLVVVFPPRLSLRGICSSICSPKLLALSMDNSCTWIKWRAFFNFCVSLVDPAFEVIALQLKARHLAGFLTEGTVLTLGTGETGQLGLGPDITERSKPARFTQASLVSAGLDSNPNDSEKFVQIVAGGMHTVCLSADGRVFSFGCNDEGALGRPSTDCPCESKHQGPVEESRPGLVTFPEANVKIKMVCSSLLKVGLYARMRSTLLIPTFIRRLRDPSY